MCCCSICSWVENILHCSQSTLNYYFIGIFYCDTYTFICDKQLNVFIILFIDQLMNIFIILPNDQELLILINFWIFLLGFFLGQLSAFELDLQKPIPIQNHAPYLLLSTNPIWTSFRHISVRLPKQVWDVLKHSSSSHLSLTIWLARNGAKGSGSRDREASNLSKPKKRFKFFRCRSGEGSSVGKVIVLKGRRGSRSPSILCLPKLNLVWGKSLVIKPELLTHTHTGWSHYIS